MKKEGFEKWLKTHKELKDYSAKRYAAAVDIISAELNFRKEILKAIECTVPH